MDDILEFRPATEQERLYTYAQTHELYMHSACLGRLRGDFDSGGYGFFTTWEDHHGAEKTPEFKAEFDRVVNALRDPSAYHGVLFSRDAMRAYCATQPDSAMQGNYTTEYAFRANTEKYAYIMRLNPTKGDYNFYIFCYDRQRLDRFLTASAKGIRFIDPHYRELFRIPDGDQIRIIRPEGDYIDRTVHFIDEYHIEVGFLSQANIYHICEFAERMEQNGNKKEQNEWDRHLEHSEQSEPTLMRRKARYEPSLEEKMLDEIERQERKSEFIRVSSRYLTKTQRRRLYRYYYQNLTYEEIAKKESVHLTTVKESIDAAIEILRKHLKSDQAN